MGRPSLTYECVGCGKPTPRRGRATDGVRCIECSVQRHVDSATQIRAREGPFYERWLAGIERAVARRRAEFEGGMDLVGGERRE